MYERCIEQQTPPSLQPGDIIRHGEFFRNLKKEHVVKRYSGDDNESPQYGFKLHKSHWKYADQQQGPLSVNLCSCMHTGVCSIALHPGGQDYYHIAIIDLDALNHCGFLSSPLLAQYQPVEQPRNNCHFEIIPEDGTVLAWMKVSVFLDRPFPAAKKLPATDEDEMKAAQEYAKYRSCFDIRRWVRKKDGTLE